MLIDSFKRPIDTLRLSLTDRCDFRCVYCMTERMCFEPREQVLSLEEMERLCGVFLRLGVRKIRLTGGEPLMRRNAMRLIRVLGQWVNEGLLTEVTLTTNGTQLAKVAADLAEAGIRRVNVSLDTLDAERFAMLTRGGSLPQVLDGIAAARAAGLRLRINCVVMRDVTGASADQLVKWCGSQGFDLCFIEMMPMGQDSTVHADAFMPVSELRLALNKRWSLIEIPYRTTGPATYLAVAETGGRIAFISPQGHGFCHECNRIRLSCTGMLYPCLGRELSHDLRTPLRQGATDAELDRLVFAGIAQKPAHHAFSAGRSHALPLRTMSVTGG